MCETGLWVHLKKTLTSTFKLTPTKYVYIFPDRHKKESRIWAYYMCLATYLESVVYTSCLLTLPLWIWCSCHLKSVRMMAELQAKTWIWIEKLVLGNDFMNKYWNDKMRKQKKTLISLKFIRWQTRRQKMHVFILFASPNEAFNNIKFRQAFFHSFRSAQTNTFWLLVVINFEQIRPVCAESRFLF